MTPISNQPRTPQPLDIEAGNATENTTTEERPSRRRPLAYAAGSVALAGAFAAGLFLGLSRHHKGPKALSPMPLPKPPAPGPTSLTPPALAPAFTPPTPAPAPEAAAPAPTPATDVSTPAPTPEAAAPTPAPATDTPAPAPEAEQPVATFAPAPGPTPANNNLTGTLNNTPFTLQKKTAMYLALTNTGGQKFAFVLSDAEESCQTLSGSPVRTSGVQEVDLCQVTTGSSVLAQNGRLIKNGQQFQSSAVSLNGSIDANRVFNGHFSMNTTSAGFVTGNFTAQPCDTMVYSTFCNLQN